MHEVSIALRLLEIITEKCREEGYQSVESARVRIGKASGILPEAFTFALEAVKKGTLAGKAKFFIDIIPLGALCGQCGNQFVTDEAYILECPSCSSTAFKINQGHELELVELEIS